MNSPAHLRIVIADDDPLLRQMLKTFLSGRGHEVFSAGSGREALAILRQGGRFDLVVTDILMPDMEGIELIRSVRHEFPEPHIIAMSGGGFFLGRDFLDEAALFGADSVLKKPFAFEELERLVVSLCGVA